MRIQVSTDSRLSDHKISSELMAEIEKTALKTSSELDFLKEDKERKEIFDNPFWSLNEENKAIKPLVFSNGKTQEKVVEEIVSLIKGGKKVIFLHGVCGTGKSAIALNIARSLGRASIVVPIKSLQKQYEEEYMGRKYLIKSNGRKVKIAMITGRENHDSIFLPGVSCADPYLPDTIKLTEKNYNKLREYYHNNPFLTQKKENPSEKDLKRISVAPANPYWSPIIPAQLELNQLKDAKKIKYSGINGRDFIFYHRKSGCSYYDQYLAYANADIIIFNSAKYLSEIKLGRKPATEVEIIDEADEFLDSLSTQTEINLTRLASSLKVIYPESDKALESIKKIIYLIDLEEKNKKAIGVDEKKVFKIDETKIKEILSHFLNNSELEAEIEIDELNYSNIALEAARDFKESFNDTYVTFRKMESDLFVNLVTTNLSSKFSEIVDGNKAVVLMSGTLHTESVLKNVFGIKEYSLVDAEKYTQGAIEAILTGKEFDCTYSKMQKDENSREKYLEALSECVSKAKKPCLIHVNAYSDLPSEDELSIYGIKNIISREKLRKIQEEDKTGKLISVFKSGLSDTLFSTKCSRGIDFPGETCNSVIFTKYPNPNVKDIFWTILQKTHPAHYWDFYKDKARREFLQRIYRAVRYKEDHVFVLSPDIRVINAIKEL